MDEGGILLQPLQLFGVTGQFGCVAFHGRVVDEGVSLVEGALVGHLLVEDGVISEWDLGHLLGVGRLVALDGAVALQAVLQGLSARLGVGLVRLGGNSAEAGCEEEEELSCCTK